MDILVCQVCGSILRGKGKFCTGCGAHISRHSPTVLPTLGASSASLAVATKPDPVLLERAVTRQLLVQENGINGDNGGNGDGSPPWMAPGQATAGTSSPVQPPYEEQPPAAGPIQPVSAAGTSIAPQPSEAPPASEADSGLTAAPLSPVAPPYTPTSPLGSVLGGAASPFGRKPAASASELLSFMEEAASQSTVTPAESGPAAQPEPAPSFEPAAPSVYGQAPASPPAAPDPYQAAVAPEMPPSFAEPSAEFVAPPPAPATEPAPAFPQESALPPPGDKAGAPAAAPEPTGTEREQPYSGGFLGTSGLSSRFSGSLRPGLGLSLGATAMGLGASGLTGSGSSFLAAPDATAAAAGERDPLDELPEPDSAIAPAPGGGVADLPGSSWPETPADAASQFPLSSGSTLAAPAATPQSESQSGFGPPPVAPGTGGAVSFGTAGPAPGTDSGLPRIAPASSDSIASSSFASSLGELSSASPAQPAPSASIFGSGSEPPAPAAPSPSLFGTGAEPPAPAAPSPSLFGTGAEPPAPAAPSPSLFGTGAEPPAPAAPSLSIFGTGAEPSAPTAPAATDQAALTEPAATADPFDFFGPGAASAAQSQPPASAQPDTGQRSAFEAMAPGAGLPAAQQASPDAFDLFPTSSVVPAASTEPAAPAAQGSPAGQASNAFDLFAQATVAGNSGIAGEQSLFDSPPQSAPAQAAALPPAGSSPAEPTPQPAGSLFEPSPQPSAAAAFDFFAASAPPSTPAQQQEPLPAAPPPPQTAAPPLQPPATPPPPELTPAGPAPAASSGAFDFFASAPQTTQADPQAFFAAADSSAQRPVQLTPGIEAQAPSSPPATTGAGSGAVPVDEMGFPDESVKRKQKEVKQDDTKPSKRLREASARDKEERDRTGDREKPPADLSAAGIMALLEGDVEIMGRQIPRKAAAVGAFVLVMLFLNLGHLGKILFPGGGGGGGGGSRAPAAAVATQAQVPNISGVWAYAYQYGQQTVQGQMEIQQEGAQFIGQGRDQAYFQIQGVFLAPNKLQFNKQYIVDDRPQGKPAVWQGDLELRPDAPYMHGVYKAVVASGYGWRRQIKEVRNIWEAQMLQSATGSAGIGDASAAEDTGTKIKKQQEFFGKIAFGFIAVGGVLVFFSFKLFGPSGLMNIWEKKKYIPSQFSAQHGKMLRELGKAPRPGGMPLGVRNDWNILQFHMPKELALTPELREKNPHMLVIGAGAKGKSRLMAHQICHDIISADRSIVVIDSDGGLVDLLVKWVAAHPKGKSLSERILVVDPTHKGEVPGYNPLEEPEDGDLQAAADAVVHGFKAIYMEPPGSQTQWNQQTANILRNAALLLMVNGRTLTDLPTLLSDNDFRDVLLEKIEKRKNERVEFPVMLEQWGQYKRLARTDQWINWVEPILNRVSPMLSDPRIRPILTKPKGELNLERTVTRGEILLVKIPQGQLGQKANLLGSLLVTGLQRAALSIASNSSKPHPCSLYLDEFDNFIEKETFDAITSETKKFQIGFCGAVKTLQHLPEDFRNQLVINVGTLFAFALAKKDGDMLGPQMFRVDGRKMKHQTITNFFNRVNTSPQFELISDEEKLNIDRVVGQEERTYFCYRVGTVAGVFHMKSPDFKEIPDKDVNWTLVDSMYSGGKDEEDD